MLGLGVLGLRVWGGWIKHNWFESPHGVDMSSCSALHAVLQLLWVTAVLFCAVLCRAVPPCRAMSS